MFPIWKNKRKSYLSKRHSTKSGIALVELAVQLPLYFLLFGLFFDLLAGFIAQAHSEIASLSLMFNFKKAPYVTSSDASTGAVIVSDLKEADKEEFLREFSGLLTNGMRNAGSFADRGANAALQMYELKIDPNTGLLAQGVAPLLKSNSFYTTDTPGSSLSCFGSNLEFYIQELKDYAQEKLSEINILSRQSIPVGKPLPMFSIPGASPQPYMDRRTMIVYMTCYQPPVAFFNKQPRVNKYIWLPGKEVL